MTDFIVPCDAVFRAAMVLKDFHEAANEWSRGIRIDNGLIVATNHKVMTVENVGGNDGVFHIAADPVLIEECRKQSVFNATVTIIVNDVLKFAVAKTSLGYVHPGNIGIWSDAKNPLDIWRSIVMRTAQPSERSVGGMFWNAGEIARLGSASPSGALLFEQNIDVGKRGTLIRDINDPDWFGMFDPFLSEASNTPATLPSWMTL